MEGKKKKDSEEIRVHDIKQKQTEVLDGMMSVLKYPNRSESEEEVEMACVPKSIKISSVGRNFGETKFDFT